MVTVELPNAKYKDSFIACLRECQKYLDVAKPPSNIWWHSWAKMDIENLQTDFKNTESLRRILMANIIECILFGLKYHD